MTKFKTCQVSICAPKCVPISLPEEGNVNNNPEDELDALFNDGIDELGYGTASFKDNQIGRAIEEYREYIGDEAEQLGIDLIIWSSQHEIDEATPSLSHIVIVADTENKRRILDTIHEYTEENSKLAYILMQWGNPNDDVVELQRVLIQVEKDYFIIT